MNRRIEALRVRSLAAIPRISSERARLMTRFYETGLMSSKEPESVSPTCAGSFIAMGGGPGRKELQIAELPSLLRCQQGVMNHECGETNRPRRR